MAWHDPGAASANWTGLGPVPVPPTDTGSSETKSKAPVRSSTRVPAPMLASVRRWTTARAGSSPTFFRTASTASRIVGGDGAVVMACMVGRPGGPGLPSAAPRSRPHGRGRRGGVDGGAADPGGAGAGAGRRLLEERIRSGGTRAGVRPPPAGGDFAAGSRAGRRRAPGRALPFGPLRHLGAEPVVHHGRLVRGPRGHPAGVGGPAGPGPGP